MRKINLSITTVIIMSILFYLFTPAIYIKGISFSNNTYSKENLQLNSDESIELSILPEENEFEIHQNIEVENKIKAKGIEQIDIIGKDIEYELINNVSNGKLTLEDDGRFKYISDEGYYGFDEFDVKVKIIEKGKVVKETTGSIKIIVTAIL